MKTIVNRRRLPIRVPLPGGKVLHLGPSKTGQIADPHVDLPAVRKLIDSGAIALLGEGEHADASAGGESRPHEGTRGHAPTKMVRPRGNR
ncbi:MAG TPA: hypothetical protein VJV75_06645 [Candidatus Polarisedimenticolia bacterium]|nr:hypothetical protein [Candidatus Polarisedimenticolia bacterium]